MRNHMRICEFIHSSSSHELCLMRYHMRIGVFLISWNACEFSYHEKSYEDMGIYSFSNLTWVLVDEISYENRSFPYFMKSMWVFISREIIWGYANLFIHPPHMSYVWWEIIWGYEFSLFHETHVSFHIMRNHMRICEFIHSSSSHEF
jgi:hypothetical protein